MTRVVNQASMYLYTMYLSTEDLASAKPGPIRKFRLILLGSLFLITSLILQAGNDSFDQRSLLSSANSPFSTQELRSTNAPAPEAPELILIGGMGIQAIVPPLTVTPQVLGAVIGLIQSDSRPEVLQYVVEKDDTLDSVAEKFDISVNTILQVNELSSLSSLSTGQQLTILPVTGAVHLVRAHDTLSEIAGWYQADVDDIVRFNQLDSASAVFAGDLLIIPDGTKPRTVPAGRLTPLANSYFIYPIPSPHRVTQGLHYYNAIDFSNAVCAESVYAAAGGSIQKTGYNYTGGNYVRVLHPNGVVTYYGHLSAVLVVPGERVLQGQIIGYTGHTGYTIPAGPAGCHLHFGVRGAANPFRK